MRAFSRAWASAAPLLVHKVPEGSGDAFNRADDDKQTAKEAEPAKKKP